MKKLIGFVLFSLTVFCSASASASLVDPYEHGFWDPVSFLVVDDPDSTDPGNVFLSSIGFGLPAGYQLEYMVGVSAWTVLQPTTVFSTPQGRETVTFRLRNSATGGVDTSGSLTFLGLESSDLYNSLVIDWDESVSMVLTVSVPGENDNVAPVPVPGALWLFGSGIAGLFAIRRRR